MKKEITNDNNNVKEKNIKEKVKQVSNIKAIITIIAIIVLVGILAYIVYAGIIKKDNQQCNQTVENVRTQHWPYDVTEKKPIIYIYPKEETKVSVKLGREENLTHTYPKYEDGWEVIASPNGDLVDCKTGRNLYSLYWEGINTVNPNMEEGFVVKGEDTIEFLEEKLDILGLNEREAEEFIVYWLPKLESNKYNFIRFQTEEEISNNMPLIINPKPDTLIRVVMEFKGLDEQINVKEQKLKTLTRTGYTVIEWGGTEVK